MIEALSRLEPEQVNANPQLKAALTKVLDATRGTPRFVELVHRFNVKDQNAALLDVVLQSPDATAGAEALRLILESHDTDLVRKSLASTNTSAAVKLADALGNAGGNLIAPLLEPVVADSQRDAALRKRAVQALAKTQDGAAFLIQLAEADKLGADLKLTASTELNRSRWPAVKTAAARVLPLPQGRNAEALPPIGQLVKMTGDPARGAEVFARPDVNCIGCHQINGKGMDFGPRLSEIGTKLAKEAIYESILDPSAGISFGYEAWQIQLKNGDDAYGLIVSETTDDIAVKTQNGVVSHYKKSAIARRDKMSTSIMPAGLQQAMSVQDLVDLVEYLASLKKAAP